MGFGFGNDIIIFQFNLGCAETQIPGNAAKEDHAEIRWKKLLLGLSLNSNFAGAENAVNAVTGAIPLGLTREQR